MIDYTHIAVVASWAATGLGVGLWLAALMRHDPLRKLRLSDCGTVLIFASVLVRLAGQTRAMTVVDWALAILSPLFIAAALFRLIRTQCPPSGSSGTRPQ